MKNVLFLLLMCLFSFAGSAQEVLTDDVDDDAEPSEGFPSSGFYIGGTGGAFFAHGGTASFYSGQGQYGINWVLSIQQYRDRIKQELGLDQQDFTMGQFPDSMTYRPAFTIGLNGGVRLNESSALFFDLNITNIKLQDVFTLYVDDPINFEPIIHQAGITGEEKRLNINLGYRQLLGTNEKARPFLELAATFNNTEVVSNEIIIENWRYSLVRPVNPTNPAQIQFITGGSAFGGLVGGGFTALMNKDFAIDFGAHMRFDKIIVDRNIENTIKPQWLLFARIVYNK